MNQKTIGAIIGGVIGWLLAQSIYGFPIPFVFPMPMLLSRFFSYIMLFPIFQILLEVVFKGESFIGLILAILYPIIIGAIEGYIIVLIVQKMREKVKSKK